VPPSDDLLRLLVSAAWWKRFDAQTASVHPVAAAIDPLHHYAIQIQFGLERQRLVAEIEARRPNVFGSAIAGLVAAICSGEVTLTGTSNNATIQILPDTLAARRWHIQREGALVVENLIGGSIAYAEARIELPSPNVEVPPGSPATIVGQTRPGRPRGRSFRGDDAKFYPQMRAMIKSGSATSPSNAARCFVGQAKGGGSDDSKVARLAKGFIAWEQTLSLSE
jgi:hypothetical protein